MSLTMKLNNNSTNRDAQSKNETDNAMWSIYLRLTLMISSLRPCSWLTIFLSGNLIEINIGEMLCHTYVHT